MDISRARYLASEQARDALNELPAEFGRLDPVRLAARLRESCPPDAAAALGEQVGLRQLARERYGELPLRLYTREGLEMMTHPLVARRRAARLAALGLPVADLGCGLGGDSRALLDAGVETVGLEKDPGTAVLAGANLDGRVLRGDAARPPLDLQPLAVFMDPSRREGGRRQVGPGAVSSPPWPVTLALAQGARAGVIKTAPGVDHALVPPGAELEFVQLGRTLREAAVWLGGNATSGLRRAVLLPAGVELDSTMAEAPAETTGGGAFIVDPSPCVTRAGLVRQLAAQLGGRLLDPRVAYLAAEDPSPHPMAANFEVLERVRFSVSRLRDLLRSRSWRPEEVRRRAFPVEPDELRRLLGRIDGDPVTLLCTTLAGERTVFVGRRTAR